MNEAKHKKGSIAAFQYKSHDKIFVYFHSGRNIFLFSLCTAGHWWARLCEQPYEKKYSTESKQKQLSERETNTEWCVALT